jgi:regulator of protease activity HflC (stomatin/prohibitin superfamily)
MLLNAPKFTFARRYAWGLFGFGLFLLAAGGALLFANRVSYPALGRPPLAIIRALGFFGASLLVAAAGLVASATMALARKALSGRGPQEAEVIIAPSGRIKRILWRSRRGLGHLKITAEAGAGWLQTALSAVIAAGAAVGVILFWNVIAPPANTPPALQILAGALVMAAFPLLVIERFYHNVKEDLLPEAVHVAKLLRLPITAAVWLAAVMALRVFGFAWAAKLEPIIGVLIFAVAAEVFVRSVSMLFLPYANLAERRATAESKIASALLCLAVPSLKKINVAVRSQLGIDLSRSWALAFIQKAVVPGFIGLAIFTWLITGVTTLPGNQRGIYERFGTPETVFGPGLHIHLPWPMGTVRPVETGTVHKLPIEFRMPMDAAAATVPEKEDVVGAEDAPPASANRLWTTGRNDEGSYIIASSDAGQQSFQLVDVDMSVVYRIGTSDDAARNAAYSVAQSDDLIQALSGQLLVHYFATNTLTDVLGQSREKFAEDFRNKLQAELDGMKSGIDAIAVLVEAVHPPPGAAAAYHSVQAAELLAQTQVATSRGDAARAVKGAQTTALRERDQAQSTAADVLANAKVDAALFKSDAQAYRNGGGFALVFERWLDQVARSVRRVPAVIIDRNIPKADTPSSDVRTNSGAPALGSPG